MQLLTRACIASQVYLLRKMVEQIQVLRQNKIITQTETSSCLERLRRKFRKRKFTESGL